MKVGDKVKVDGFDGFYSTYEDWAEVVGAQRWAYYRYPKSMEFTIKAIAPHLTCGTLLYLLSNDEGDFIFNNTHSNITIVKRTRTRTEYEKVTESIFDLRKSLECGELYGRHVESIKATSLGEGSGVTCGYSRITSELELFKLAVNGDAIYRKVEKEIDWRDEVKRFLESSCKESSSLDGDSFTISHPDLGFIYEPGDVDFLELCRVALRANGEIE